MTEFRTKFLEKYPGINLENKIYPQMVYAEYLLIAIPKMIVSIGSGEMFLISCNERFSYIGDHYNGSCNDTLMVKFVFECEYVGRRDGLTGQDPIYLLAKEYPKRILDFFDQNPVDINEMFESNIELKTRYCSLEY